MIPGLFAFDAPASPEPIPMSLGPLARFRAPFLAKQLYQCERYLPGSCP